jgi:glycosyltransferase involved in cell wall biosynthesis
MAIVTTLSNPKISVIMAVKDSEKYLREAIESVLQQTFTDFEFIIIDDYSTDSSAKIVLEYKDLRIKCIKNQSPLGLAKSLNIGLDIARGEYIARLDADDVCLPNRFEHQVRFLNEHPQIGVLGSGIRLIDDQGNTIYDVHFPTDHDVIKWQLCFHNPIAHPTVMMRLAVVKQADGYDPALIRSQDYDLWWRMSLISELANLYEINIHLRQHSGQVTNVQRNEQFECGLKINQRYLSALVGAAISQDVIRNLWTNNYPTLKDGVSAGHLILDCLDRICESVQSNRLKQSITQDAFSKVSLIVGPFLEKPKTWCLLWRTFDRMKGVQAYL